MTFVYLVQYRDPTTGDAWTCDVYKSRASANHHIKHAQSQWEALMAGDPQANVSCNCTSNPPRAHVEERFAKE